jgi:hypothetical protein
MEVFRSLSTNAVTVLYDKNDRIRLVRDEIIDEIVRLGDFDTHALLAMCQDLFEPTAYLDPKLNLAVLLPPNFKSTVIIHRERIRGDDDPKKEYFGLGHLALQAVD